MSHEVDINRADVFLVVYSKEQEWDANTRSSKSLETRTSHLE